MERGVGISKICSFGVTLSEDVEEDKEKEITNPKKFFQFEKLDVWKLSVDWADEMMALTDRLPQNYQFSLGEQIRRAALSVPTNIAEGTGRSGEKEKKYFYNVAKGSVYVVVSLLVMCGKRQIISRDGYRTYHNDTHKIASMLTGLLRSKKLSRGGE